MAAIWTLPIPSQEITEGPDVQLRPGSLAVRFCGEDEIWHELSFSEVLKFVFTEFRACSADAIEAYDKLLDLGTESTFAREARADAHTPTDELHHYRIFFDDVGCYDIIARSAKWS